MIKINLNVKVRVYLEESGCKIYYDHLTEMEKLLPENIKDGFHKIIKKVNCAKEKGLVVQFHEFMNIFGGHLLMGFNNPIKMTVEVDNECY